MRSNNLMVLVTVLVLVFVVSTDAMAYGRRFNGGYGYRGNNQFVRQVRAATRLVQAITRPNYGYGYARPVYPAYGYVQTAYPVVQQVVVVQRAVVVDPLMHADGYSYGGGGVFNRYNPSAYAGMDDGTCNNGSNVTYRVRGTGGVRFNGNFGSGITDNATYRAGGGGVRYSGSTGITDNRPYNLGGGGVQYNHYDASTGTRSGGGRGLNNGSSQNGRGM